MRIFVIFLILYSNTVAPWLCCCAVSRGSICLKTECQTVPSGKPCCTTQCCEVDEIGTNGSPVNSPNNQRPCPIWELFLLERPTANIERIDLEIQTVLQELGQHTETVLDIEQFAGLVQCPAIGSVPTLLMSELRLKYHHAYLC